MQYDKVTILLMSLEHILFVRNKVAFTSFDVCQRAVPFIVALL